MLLFYSIGPCSSSTTSCYAEGTAEISPSLTFLGQKGILNTAHGITIGYLSGIDTEFISQETPASECLPIYQFNEKTIDDLLVPLSSNSGFSGVDIALTSIWPAEVYFIHTLIFYFNE